MKTEGRAKTKKEALLEAWAKFCKEYKPTKFTEREKTVFKTGQVAEDRVEKLHYAAKEVIR